MKVITNYPVYIDDVRESDADLYMSEYPETMSSFDSTKEAQVKAFQNWLDVKYPTWFQGGKLNRDVSKGYGIYNAETKSADEKYGKEFDTAVMGFIPTLGQVAGAVQGATTGFNPFTLQPKPTSTTTTNVIVEDNKRKEEEEKKRKKTTNIIIFSSIGAVALGLIIYLATKKK